MPKTKLSEFKLGDKVKILPKESQPNSWGDIWTSDMDSMVGSIREVDGYNGNRNTYTVGGLNFPRESLLPIEEDAMTRTQNVEDRMNMDRFKVGDEVVVTEVVLKQKGWESSWLLKMNEAVGKKFKVKAINNDLGYCLSTGGSGIGRFGPGEDYWFPEAALSSASAVDVNPLVQPAAKAPAKKKRVRVGPDPGTRRRALTCGGISWVSSERSWPSRRRRLCSRTAPRWSSRQSKCAAPSAIPR